MFIETTKILLIYHRIDEHGNIKVADFGLSKDVSGNIYFRQEMSSGVKLPLKWMAIESIEDGIFTEKTDIVREINICITILTQTHTVVIWYYSMGSV